MCVCMCVCMHVCACVWCAYAATSVVISNNGNMIISLSSVDVLVHADLCV